MFFKETDSEISILTVHLGKIQFAQLSGSTGTKLPDPELPGDNPDLSTENLVQGCEGLSLNNSRYDFILRK